MYSDLRVPLPPELEPFRAELEYFMASMLRKLHINRHKGFIEGKSVKDFVRWLDDERDELGHSLEDEGQFESFMEAVDMANMAFLLAAKVASMTKIEFEAQRK